MFLICVVFVWIILTYCTLRFSVSSSFIVIAPCSNLSTSFLKSQSGSRNEEGCDALFLIAILLIGVLESSLKFLSFLYFCNHECLVNMLFKRLFQFFLLIV